MNAGLQEMLNFHLTGKRPAATAVPATGACPALLAPYRRLEALRYDFPLILVDNTESPAFVDSLTGVVNRLLREIAPQGNAGESLRQHVLRLEGRMRELVADGCEATLRDLWKKAEKSLLAECEAGEAERLGNSIATARFALRIDGHVADCNEHLPARLLGHAWAQRESRRARESLAKIDTLIIRLRDILKVDELKSAGSRTPQKLKMTLGRRYREAFDFDLMAELLDDSAARNRLPAGRRKRIRWALETLEKQAFFADPDVRADRRGSTTHDFLFDGLAPALKAYNERLPELADVVKALAIAELECDNAYCEEKHDAYFDRFGPQAVGEEDLRRFPAYLVCLREVECTSRDTLRLMEILSCDLPMKVLVLVDDPLGTPSPVDGLPHQGSIVQQLVHGFVAGDAFVMQAAASGLLRQQDTIRRGLEYSGPAVFSVFAPRDDKVHALPTYLVAAAATESRAFPAFSYDPAAGSRLADRIDIAANPDAAEDWPLRTLTYEDESLQGVTEGYRFTVVDFAVLDPHYAEHFAQADRGDWGTEMLPVSDYLDKSGTIDAVPYVTVADGEDRLWRWVADDRLLRLARRCRERWHTLQDLGRKDAAAAPPAEVAEVPEEVSPAETIASDEAAAAASPAVMAETDEPAADAGDEPWIETPRCTTCDECTKRNPRMFAYDDNKQAYISDPDAGTFRDLVEAAENCQVAIIHPGKPRNPDEPGLDELLRRAEPFAA